MAEIQSIESHKRREPKIVSDDVYYSERLGALSVEGVQAVADTARIKGDAEKLAKIATFANRQAELWSAIFIAASEPLKNIIETEGSNNGN
jgi:hypothetical protein